MYEWDDHFALYMLRRRYKPASRESGAAAERWRVEKPAESEDPRQYRGRPIRIATGFPEDAQRTWDGGLRDNVVDRKLRVSFYEERTSRVRLFTDMSDLCQIVAQCRSIWVMITSRSVFTRCTLTCQRSSDLQTSKENIAERCVQSYREIQATVEMHRWMFQTAQNRLRQVLGTVCTPKGFRGMAFIDCRVARLKTSRCFVWFQNVDLEDFREAVKKLSLGLTEPEIVSFFEAFDSDGSGGIDFSEVSDALCQTPHTVLLSLALELVPTSLTRRSSPRRGHVG